MKNFIPYIGGKYRLAGVISKRLHATGGTCLVDVFGGSGAVTLHSGFRKRIYNDVNGDIVNLFRVMATDKGRMVLLKKLRWAPPSRQLFEDDHEVFRRGGFSFRLVDCPMERARMTFYRHIFCFAAKTRSAGFTVSIADSIQIKEASKYQNVLRSFALFGRFFSNTVIENLDFADLIESYGHKEKVVFFVDPPYPGFSYYSDNLSNHQHEQLATMLLRTPAPVICTFYDHPLVRKLYPEDVWDYEVVNGCKNSNQGGNKTTEELILTRKAVSQERINRCMQGIGAQATMEFESV